MRRVGERQMETGRQRGETEREILRQKNREKEAREIVRVSYKILR
jgi:hypothetical protein